MTEGSDAFTAITRTLAADRRWRWRCRLIRWYHRLGREGLAALEGLAQPGVGWASTPGLWPLPPDPDPEPDRRGRRTRPSP